MGTKALKSFWHFTLHSYRPPQPHGATRALIHECFIRQQFMQLLHGNLTPLPISHTWATCQQPTVSATHGRLHSGRDDTKSAHCDFHHKHWEGGQSSHSGDLSHCSEPWSLCFQQIYRRSLQSPQDHNTLLCCTADGKAALSKKINSLSFIFFSCWLFTALLHLTFFLSFFFGEKQTGRRRCIKEPRLRLGCLATREEIAVPQLGLAESVLYHITPGSRKLMERNR